MTQIAEPILQPHIGHAQAGAGKDHGTYWSLAAIILLLVVALCNARTSAQETPFTYWSTLKNPVLSYPNWSVKDAAMANMGL